MPKALDLRGAVFGRLRVLERAPNHPNRTQSVTAWWCECTCGAQVAVQTRCLRKAETRSCGCHRRELGVVSMKTNRHPKLGESRGKRSSER